MATQSAACYSSSIPAVTHSTTVESQPLPVSRNSSRSTNYATDPPHSAQILGQQEGEPNPEPLTLQQRYSSGPRTGSIQGRQQPLSSMAPSPVPIRIRSLRGYVALLIFIYLMLQLLEVALSRKKSLVSRAICFQIAHSWLETRLKVCHHERSGGCW